MSIKTEKPADRARNRPLKDYAGERFGRLVAVGLHSRDTSRENNHVWAFVCDCGGKKLAKIKSVRAGKTQSCGCMAREVVVDRSTKHGLSKTHSAEYRSWKDMRSRCNSPENSDFANYGARGIRVCPEWDDFAVFFADMGVRPQNSTIDRINVNEGYSPDNCRWATATQQANNKRSNRVIEIEGTSQTLQQWCREYGVDHSKVRYRLSIGMTLPEALTAGDLRSRGSSTD